MAWHPARMLPSTGDGLLNAPFRIAFVLRCSSCRKPVSHLPHSLCSLLCCLEGLLSRVVDEAGTFGRFNKACPSCLQLALLPHPASPASAATPIARAVTKASIRTLGISTPRSEESFLAHASSPDTATLF